MIKTPNKGTLCGKFFSFFFVVENIKYFNTHMSRKEKCRKKTDYVESILYFQVKLLSTQGYEEKSSLILNISLYTLSNTICHVFGLLLLFF